MYVLGSHVPMLFVIDTTAKTGKNGEGFKNAHFTKLPDSLNYGIFSAIDVATGKIRWQRRARSNLMYGGAVATQGGLVFYGDIEGYLNGLDAETGRRSGATGRPRDTSARRSPSRWTGTSESPSSRAGGSRCTGSRRHWLTLTGGPIWRAPHRKATFRLLPPTW